MSASGSLTTGSRSSTIRRFTPAASNVVTCRAMPEVVDIDLDDLELLLEPGFVFRDEADACRPVDGLHFEFVVVLHIDDRHLEEPADPLGLLADRQRERALAQGEQVAVLLVFGQLPTHFGLRAVVAVDE